MRTQTEGSVVTAVMKREFQTPFHLRKTHLMETMVKFKLNHTKNET